MPLGPTWPVRRIAVVEMTAVLAGPALAHGVDPDRLIQDLTIVSHCPE
jgi:hypothetical protein